VRVVGSAAQRLVSDERFARGLSWTTGGMGWDGSAGGETASSSSSEVELVEGQHRRAQQMRGSGEDERGDLLDSCSQFCS
jgi:hypothetical protein